MIKMIIDVILGNNVDTKMWINDLRESKADYIIVIDYEYSEESKETDGILYMSPNYAREYIKEFDSINYYKSLYAYPSL